MTASSEIEDIVVPDRLRAESIIEGRVGVLRTRNEQELAGYRDALDYGLQQNEDWRPLNVGLLLHLHRLLFGRTTTDVSDQTIRMVLEQLRHDGEVAPDGLRRAAVWVLDASPPPLFQLEPTVTVEPGVRRS